MKWKNEWMLVSDKYENKNKSSSGVWTLVVCSGRGKHNFETASRYLSCSDWLISLSMIEREGINNDLLYCCIPVCYFSSFSEHPKIYTFIVTARV